MSPRTMTEFGDQAHRMAPALKQAERAATRQGALELTTLIRRNIQQIAPTSSIHGRRPGTRVKVGARYVMQGDGTQALVKATGPLQILERDTKAHTEPKQAAKLTKSGKARKNARTVHVLVIPGIGFRRSAKHPGTKGQHPFERALVAYAPRLPVVYREKITVAMQRTFR